MIDFHSHILPNVDDGSRSYEESVNLLKEAKNYGFDKVISTSHYALELYETPEYKRKELLDDLSSEENVPKLYLGSEIFISYNMIDFLKEFKASTINNTNYILIELPLKHNFRNYRDIIMQLQDDGYKVILAHPERYSIIQSNYKLLHELRDIGVIFQSNYGSILGLYGFSAKITFKKMLKEGIIDMLGTDVHRQNSIYPKVPKAIKKISKYVDNNSLYTMTTENAEKILNNDNI